MPRWVRIYLIPAAVFQSVLVGGGYGTGREVVEFVTTDGPQGGLIGILYIFLALSVVLVLTFEFARHYRVYDYRRFFMVLIGRGWVLYEILAILLLTIVLAVVLSAAATLIFDWLGIPVLVTGAAVVVLVMVLLFWGTGAVERFLSGWAIIFSVFLLCVALAIFIEQGSNIAAKISQDEVGAGSGLRGLRFASYNIAAIPVLLYTTTAIKRRWEAVFSGVVAAAAGTLPALLMHLTFVPGYPAVLELALPMLAIVESFDSGPILVFYGVFLIGMIVQTAIGVLEGVVQRIDGWLADTDRRPMTQRGRGLLAGAIMLAGAGLSVIGVVDLVAQGYGTLGWGFLAVYAVPLCTLGIYKIARGRGDM